MVEFDGGVSAQRGLASFSTTDLTKTVTVPGLTAATLPKSFVLISQWTYDTSDTSDSGWTVTAQLSTVTPGNLVPATGTRISTVARLSTLSTADVNR